MGSFSEMQYTATNIFSAYASLTGTFMLFRSVANEMVPEPVKSFVYSLFKKIFDRFFAEASNDLIMVVDEQVGMSRNQIYDAAEVYLRTKINPDAERLKANKTTKQKSITVSMVKDHEVFDEFKEGSVRLKWQFVLVEPEGDKQRFQQERRYFELSFHKRCKDVVVNEYLPFVLAKAKEIKDNERAVKLYTRDCPFYDDDDDEGGNGCGGDWGCINLDHPVTFEKLAMDPKLKKDIVDDLDRFLRRKDYYRKVGKAWKRGYLLYGPPGTGKSSLIAAIANYLRFNVYDLELTSVYSNADLRRTLLSTNNKSIIVIEDIDCSSNMHDRGAESDSEESYSDTKVTLSGLLNFIDGLWSSCGDERIIIFTTNHKEKLDPALLRPGRMDMHIYMGYCTPEGFDVLALNYLGISDHPTLFPVIKDLVREVEITPAEVAEHLMRSEDAELALEGVIDLLRLKKEKANVEQQKKLTESNEAKIKDNDDGGKAGNDADCGKEKKIKKGKFGKVLKSLMGLNSK